jgi:deoxyribonuclease IV
VTVHFGSHLSIAGSLVNALEEAVGLGLGTVQVFTKNQQQWKAKPLDPGVARAWRDRVNELGWSDRTVSHASYLINLASPDDELWRKSIDLMTDEIERCEALRIPLLVHHPGAFTTSTREAGIGRIGEAYRELFRRTRGFRTVSCLENTVGSGSNLGRTFEELAELRARIVEGTAVPERVGVCIDTCHMHAGGYDLSTPASAEAALDELERTLPPGAVRCLHLNDSKAPAGSRRDRHEHIGRGTIGEAGFSAVLARRCFAGLPAIMETPKDGGSVDEPWDAVNLRTLRRLAGVGAAEPAKSPRATVANARPKRAAARPKARASGSPKRGAKRSRRR